MRKLASQVPELVSRLQRAHIGASSPPTWLAPVIAHPPPIQPSRSTVARTARIPAGKGESHSTEVPLYNDLFPRRWNATAEGGTRTHKSKHFRAPHPRPQAIVYEEDRVRRQFFRDFPYEAMRPTSLVEGREVDAERVVDGQEWVKLSQRGIYPTVEDTIAFTLNQHHVHGKTMSDAYFAATHEFVELRAHHELATIAAEQEALAYGATFRSSPFEKQNAALATNSSSNTTISSTSTQTSNRYRKPARWTAVAPTSLSSSADGSGLEGFTAGRSYVDNWALPPPLAMPVTEATVAEAEAESKDAEIAFAGTEAIGGDLAKSDKEVMEAYMAKAAAAVPPVAEVRVGA